MHDTAPHLLFLEKLRTFCHCCVKDGFYIHWLTIDGVYKYFFNGKADFFCDFAVIIIQKEGRCVTF